MLYASTMFLLPFVAVALHPWMIVATNGGVDSGDVWILSITLHSIDIKRVDSNHHIMYISIMSAGGVVHTQHGFVIAILNQYAGLGLLGHTIH